MVRSALGESDDLETVVGVGERQLALAGLGLGQFPGCAVDVAPALYLPVSVRSADGVPQPAAREGQDLKPRGGGCKGNLVGLGEGSDGAVDVAPLLPSLLTSDGVPDLATGDGHDLRATVAHCQGDRADGRQGAGFGHQVGELRPGPVGRL